MDRPSDDSKNSLVGGSQIQNCPMDGYENYRQLVCPNCNSKFGLRRHKDSQDINCLRCCMQNYKSIQQKVEAQYGPNSQASLKLSELIMTWEELACNFCLSKEDGLWRHRLDLKIENIFCEKCVNSEVEASKLVELTEKSTISVTSETQSVRKSSFWSPTKPLPVDTSPVVEGLANLVSVDVQIVLDEDEADSFGNKSLQQSELKPEPDIRANEFKECADFVENNFENKEGVFFWTDMRFSSNLVHGAEVKVSFSWIQSSLKLSVFANADIDSMLRFQFGLQKKIDFLDYMYPDHIPVKNEVVIVLHEKSYYRARVIKVERKTCYYDLIDLSLSGCCPIEELAWPDVELIEHPVYCMPVELHGVPKDLLSNLKNNERFMEMLNHQKLIHIIDDKSPRPGPNGCLNEPYSVQLQDLRTKSTINSFITSVVSA